MVILKCILQPFTKVYFYIDEQIATIYGRLCGHLLAVFLTIQSRMKIFKMFSGSVGRHLGSYKHEC